MARLRLDAARRAAAVPHANGARPRAWGVVAYSLLRERRRIAARNIDTCLARAATRRSARGSWRSTSKRSACRSSRWRWAGSARTRPCASASISRAQSTSQPRSPRARASFCSRRTSRRSSSSGPALRPLCPKLCGMYKWQRNPVMNRIMNRGRGRYFDTMFAKDNVREMMRSLRDERRRLVRVGSELRRQGQRSPAVLRRAGDDEHGDRSNRESERRRRAAVLLPPAPSERYVMSIGAPLAGVAERRRGRRHTRVDEADRGLHTAVPGAILVDPSALQGPPRTAAGSVCRADALKPTRADRSA